ncbi:MAG: APC family permease, partial [Firmicutes bacterium]|nr:APC family permease [Bacillota bacterium]
MSAKTSLRRVLTLRTAVSTSAGLASAAVNFLACVEIAVYAGPIYGAVALLISGGLIALVAGNFAELSAMYPSASAVRLWLKRGLSDRFSMEVSLMYAATVVFVMAADAFVLAHVFTSLWPSIPGVLWIILTLAALTLLNLQGVKLSARWQDSNALVLLTTVVIFSVLVLLRVPSPHIAVAHYPVNWIEAVSLGVFVFVGFEWVTPLAEEFRDAHVIPRALFIALGVIAVAFGLFMLALGRVFPDAHGLMHTVVPQLAVGRRALGNFGWGWMAFVSLTTAMTTFNGGLATASRFVYALARERVLPPSWAHLNDRLVPSRALWGLAGIAAVLAVIVYASGQYEYLIDAG